MSKVMAQGPAKSKEPRIPYSSEIITDHKRDKNTLFYQILGGRTTQEDAHFFYSDSNYQVGVVLDGFAGEAATIFAKHNLERVLKEKGFNLKETIDQLDLELRVCALTHPDYKTRVMKVTSQPSEVDPYLQEIEEEMKALVAMKGIVEAELQKKYDGPNPQSKRLFDLYTRYHSNSKSPRDNKVILERKMMEFIALSKYAPTDFKDNYLPSLKKGQKPEEIIDLNMVKTSCNPSSKQEELFKEYIEIIKFGKVCQDEYLKSGEANTYQIRVDLITQLIDKTKESHGKLNEILNIQDDKPESILKGIVHFKQFKQKDLQILEPFYDEKVSINLDIQRGWNLILFLQTLNFLLEGIPIYNPLMDESREEPTEEQIEAWKKEAMNQGLIHEDDDLSQDGLQELQEDLYQSYNAAFLTLKQYVIRRVCHTQDNVVRFGERLRVGTTIIGLKVDKKNNQRELAWRGDSVALRQTVTNKQPEPELELISVEHFPNGNISIDVGRFLGAILQEDFYALNNSQVTEAKYNQDVGSDEDLIVLMTDGAYRAQKASGIKKYHTEIREDFDFYEKTRAMLKPLNYQEGGTDNCTIMITKLDLPEHSCCTTF